MCTFNDFLFEMIICYYKFTMFSIYMLIKKKDLILNTQVSYEFTK